MENVQENYASHSHIARLEENLLKCEAADDEKSTSINNSPLFVIVER